MVGIQRGLKRGRNGVDQAYRALKGQFEGGMLGDLRKADLLEVFMSKNKAMEKDIARELWQIRPDGEPGITKNAQAMQMAQIINKWQRASLERLNRAGAYVKELKGYVVRQSHDSSKIMKADLKSGRSL
jgi:hypothetical protein